MAGELEYQKEVQKQLDETSPSFCLAKWLQVTLHLQNGRNHSCHHPGTHAVSFEEIKENPTAIHNSNYKKGLRKQMLEGERPPECQYCWNVEDLPGDYMSDRIMKSADSIWAQPYREKVLGNEWDENINPTYVEVSFSNVCNFKCSYCSPVHSSQWVHEVEKEGPYMITGRGHNNLEYYKQNKEMPIHHKDHNPYVEAFWEWWPDLVKDLRVFRITGGEPLLDKNTFKVLDFLYDNPQSQLEVDINSNLGIPDKQLDLYIEKVKRLVDEGKVKKSRLYTSVDSHGEQAEYGRSGLDYNKWLSNMDKVLTELPLTKITIMCTTNIFSITTFDKLLKDILFLKEKHKVLGQRAIPITLDMSILRWPGHQCAAILPPEYADFLEPARKFMRDNQENTGDNQPYQGFFDFEIAKMDRFIEFVKQPVNEAEGMHVPTMLKDFYLFVNEHDRRRGTNFLQTFPELEEFYRICEHEHNNRII